jgi:hypothetical protein
LQGMVSLSLVLDLILHSLKLVPRVLSMSANKQHQLSIQHMLYKNGTMFVIY